MRTINCNYKVLTLYFLLHRLIKGLIERRKVSVNLGFKSLSYKVVFDVFVV